MFHHTHFQTHGTKNGGVNPSAFATAGLRSMRPPNPDAVVDCPLHSFPFNGDADRPDATANSVYKGLAMANRKDGGPTLYATNFRNGTIDVFDSSFNLVTTFVDPNRPAVPP
jgi:hypothetical protein